VAVAKSGSDLNASAMASIVSFSFTRQPPDR
jgi:hypothetical protein